MPSSVLPWLGALVSGGWVIASVEGSSAGAAPMVSPLAMVGVSAVGTPKLAVNLRFTSVLGTRVKVKFSSKGAVV